MQSRRQSLFLFIYICLIVFLEVRTRLWRAGFGDLLPDCHSLAPRLQLCIAPQPRRAASAGACPPDLHYILLFFIGLLLRLGRWRGIC
jgi:hypothetical protein